MSIKKSKKEFSSDLRELAKMCNPFEPIQDTTKMSGEVLLLSGLECNPKEINKEAVYEVTYYHYRWINPYRQLKKLVNKCKTEAQKHETVIQYIQAHQ